MQPSRRLPILLGAVLPAVAMAVVACGGSSSSSTTSTATTTPPATTSSSTASSTAAPGPAKGTGEAVTVTLGKPSEFKMSASPATVPAGKVTFTVKDEGTISHSMVIVPEPAGGVTALKTSTGAPDIKGNLGNTGPLAPGATKTLTATVKKGKYILLCDLPGHFAGGMWTTFTVS